MCAIITEEGIGNGLLSDITYIALLHLIYYIDMFTVRLFIDQKLYSGKQLVLNKVLGHHVRNVLRLQTDDLLVVFDGSGGEYEATIVKIDKQDITVKVNQHHLINKTSSLKITLLQAISRSQKMDLTLQKATELGVYRIIPLITQYSNARLYTQLHKKIDHWRKVIISACEQCGQNQLPELVEPLKFDDEFGKLGNGSSKIILQPGAKDSLSKMRAPEDDHIMILVGPESGFSDAELSKAHEFGYQYISLGPRILRTETAALAAISSCQMLWGDLN